MNAAERLRRLNTLFDAALDLPEAERAALVQRECADDASLHAELTRLLAREQALDGLSTQSAVGVFSEGIEAVAIEADQGRQLGPYRIEEEIGRGGMGRVFRALRTDGVIEQAVAIKLIRRELLHPAMLKRFSTERRVLAALDHPGISRLIDAGQTADGTPYVVMELVRGEPLLEYCDRRQLPIPQRLELFRKILEAVAHAHRNLVVHRDLKPGNVLVTEEGEPKLLDFGIAKPLEGLSGATATAERFFTPAFAAPEQLRGGPITVGCDVYALGVLLYEVLTGRLPFLTDDLSPGEVERLILSVPPPAMAGVVTQGDPARALQRGVKDVQQLRRQLAGDLEAIVQRAMRKEPDARYATVEQFDADIAAYLERRPVSASGVQFGYRLRKFVSRHRLAVGLASVAAISMLSAAALLAWQNIALTHERDRARYALNFMKEAFASADPAKAAGADVTARQILAGARRQIEDLHESRPDLYASLAETIAEVEIAVGLPQDAADLAEQAVAAARRSEADSATVQQLLILQGKALYGAGKLDDAEQRLGEARALSPEPPVQWQFARGRLLTLRARPMEALPLLESAMLAVAETPSTDQFATSVRWQLAEVFRVLGQFDKSLATLDDTLRWQHERLSPGHPRVVLTRLRRVDVLRGLERFDEALTEGAAVADAVETFYGVDTPLAAFARMSYGSALLNRDRVEEAVVQYRTSLQAWRKSLGNSHPNTIRTAFNLAVALSKLPKPDPEAEALHAEVLREGAQRFGVRNNATVFFRIGFTDYLLRFGRPAEALRLLLDADGVAGLEAASADNRSDYRDLLREAVDKAGCAKARPAAPTGDCEAAAQLIEALP